MTGVIKRADTIACTVQHRSAKIISKRTFVRRSVYRPILKKKFICRKCSPNVEKKSHKEEGCASCNEIEYFKKDLLHCVKATADDDIIGRAKDVCDSIDIMQGHTARVSNQVAMI